MTQLETLIEEIPKYLPGADLDLLTRAYHFSEHSHLGQQRASGEPYLSHPLEVAGLLVDFKMDVTTVTAGLRAASERRWTEADRSSPAARSSSPVAPVWTGEAA